MGKKSLRKPFDREACLTGKEKKGRGSTVKGRKGGEHLPGKKKSRGNPRKKWGAFGGSIGSAPHFGVFTRKKGQNPNYLERKGLLIEKKKRRRKSDVLQKP